MPKALDDKKFGIALKPINMVIINYLQQNQNATTKTLVEQAKGYGQASVYRAVNELLEANILVVEKEEKVHSVKERYVRLNDDVGADLDDHTKQDRYEDVVKAVNIWMGTVTKEIKDYLSEWSQTEDPIRFGMGRELLQVSDENLEAFYRELFTLIQKYQAIPTKGDEKIFAFSASWVPVKKG